MSDLDATVAKAVLHIAYDISKERKSIMESEEHVVVAKCPICGNVSEIEMTDDQYSRYSKWKRKEMLIQEALPELTAEEREILMTGFCKDCQKGIFGN